MSHLTPQRFFLAAALLGGFALLVATPPFQVPDEPAHFYRAYALTEGRLGVGSQQGVPGELLPSSLRQLVHTLSEGIPFHPEEKIRPGAWKRAAELELEPHEREFVAFPTSAHYSAVPYLPQAAGIAVGRALGASPLALVFLGRAGNLLVAVALIYWALGKLPSYRWLAALLALTPMAMFLRSSLSADAAVTAVAFVLTATILDLAFGPRPQIRGLDVGILTAAAAALCLTKPVYFPLVLALLVIPTGRLSRHRRRPAVVGGSVVLVGALLAAIVIALRSVSRLSYITVYRLEEILYQPLGIAGSIFLDYLRNGPRYAAELIGRLGWLDTPLPPLLLVAYLAMLVLFLFWDADPPVVVRPWQRMVLALVVAASLAAISLALYVLGGRVAGIQGRYFLPLALAAVWIFHPGVARLGRAPWLRPTAATLLTAVSLVVTLLAISRRYYP